MACMAMLGMGCYKKSLKITIGKCSKKSDHQTWHLNIQENTVGWKNLSILSELFSLSKFPNDLVTDFPEFF